MADDIRINVAERMALLIERLHKDGVNGVRFPEIKSECPEDWSNDYAIACDAYCPDLFGLDDGSSHYFDHSELEYDFKELVKKHFADDPTIIVQFHNLKYGSNELEVYRDEESVQPFDQKSQASGADEDWSVPKNPPPLLIGNRRGPAWIWWAIHNLLAHPICEILHWIGLGGIGNRLHDGTVPIHEKGTGRG